MDVAYLRFSKVFDTLFHCIPMVKEMIYGLYKVGGKLAELLGLNECDQRYNDPLCSWVNSVQCPY